MTDYSISKLPHNFFFRYITLTYRLASTGCDNNNSSPDMQNLSFRTQYSKNCTRVFKLYNLDKVTITVTFSPETPCRFAGMVKTTHKLCRCAIFHEV